nr:hypothetical protein [Streptomyces atroolivaceus]
MVFAGKYDDLDGNEETFAGYWSVLRRSARPARAHGLGADREAVAMLIDSWDDIPHELIVMCVPTNPDGERNGDHSGGARNPGRGDRHRRSTW